MIFLIADDELPIREWLKVTAEKATQDGSLILSASNGEEALALYEQYSPDIVFSDIKMPAKDGIEFLKEIRKRSKYTYVVMLTSYSDFDYVRTALEYKADEYVLKKEITVNTINDIKERYLNRKDESKQLNIIDIQFKRAAFFKEIFENGFEYNEKSKERLTNLGILLDDKPIIAVAYHIEDDLFDYEQKSNLFVSKDSNLENATYFQVDKYVFVIIANVNMDKIKVSNNQNHIWEEAFENGDVIFNRSRKGVSEILSGLSDLHACIRQSLIALNRGFYENDKFIHYAAVDFDQTQYQKQMDEIEQQITDEFEDKDIVSVQRDVETLLKVILKYKPTDLNRMKKRMTGLVETCVSRCKHRLDAGTAEEIKTIKQQILDAFTFSEFKALLNALFDKLLAANNIKYHNAYVEEAIQYINHNYQEIQTINDISAQLNINPEYFCRVFKSETGTTVNNYLTMFRLNMAEKMLQTTHCNVNEVASLVGYQNPNYFSRLFKKLKGKNPSEIKS